MLFPQPLRRGRLLARYKRFFADVVLDDEGPVTAHVPNSGRMLGLTQPGSACWLSRSDSATRKLPWTLEIVEEAATGVPVGVNTMLPNRLTEEALRAGAIPELAGYGSVRREAAGGAASRLDFLLDDGPAGRRCWVEVKSATLSRTPGLAEWPDCVSSRTSRQLADLRDLAAGGDRAVVLFLAQRTDCVRFAPAADIDPAFGAALADTRRAGVEVLCYEVALTPSGAAVGRPLIVDGGGPPPGP